MANEISVEDVLKLAAEVASDPNRFVGYRDKPVQFIEEILGVHLWEGQKRVARATARHRATSVRSGHGIGKSVVAACIAIWWLYARRGLVITTAPTKEHVEDVLWREIGLRFRNAIVPLPGDCHKTQLKVTPDWYAVGLTTDQPDAFRGRHHPDLLVVVDEASGVPELVHAEISSLCTGARNHRLMIGNPTSLNGTFYESHNKQGAWHTIHLSCLDHPNVTSGTELIPGAVTREWVEEYRAKYGEKHPIWYSRVLGEFPKISDRGVVPLAWVERAENDTERLKAIEEAEKARLPRIGGLDVARYGENKCVLFVRRGDAVEHMTSWSHASLMETAGLAMKAIADWDLQTLVVDASGIGAGVVDRLLEEGAPVIGYNGGHRAFTPASFSNRRTEMWWALRTRLEKGRLWLMEKHELQPDLRTDLIGPKYKLNSSGRIQMDSKESMMEEGYKSPDVADALVCSFALDQDPMELEPVAPDPRKDQTQIFTPVNPGQEFDQLPWGF